MKTFDLVCVHSKLMTYKSGCGSRTSQPQGTAGAQACKSRNEKESLNSIWRSEYLSPEHLCNDASSNQEKLQLGRYTQTAWSSMYPKNKEKVGSFITRRNVTYLFFKKVRGTCKVLGSEQALIGGDNVSQGARFLINTALPPAECAAGRSTVKAEERAFESLQAVIPLCPRKEAEGQVHLNSIDKKTDPREIQALLQILSQSAGTQRAWEY
nr:uncharacterized protein LOC123570192 isoform X1 [Macaca fascicularis]